MNRKLNWLLVEKTLLEKNIRIFSPFEFSQIFGVSSCAAQQFLEYYAKKGAFLRPKKGIYITGFNRPSEMVIANRLYAPSYISLETALSFYHLIPETIYTVTSVTPLSSREFSLGEMSFLYTKIKKDAFAGYTSLKYLGDVVFFATPEKALVDYFYLVSIGKKTFNDRLETKSLNWLKVQEYGRLFCHSGTERTIYAYRG